jgi:hypothetical protein
MPNHPMVAEKPRPLTGEALTRRIYAPEAYHLVRTARIVPIVHSEAARLAAFFPLAFTRRDGAPELVVLRSLLPDQRGQPPRGRRCLPLLLYAYPFVQGSMESSEPPLIDDVFADEPTDIGATVLNPDMRPSLATQLRLESLAEFAHHLPLTAAIGAALAEHDLLEPWQLRFDIEGEAVAIEGLEIIRQAAYETPRFASLLGGFGLPAAQLVGLHRLSLFRAGILLTMAKAALQAKDEDEAAPGTALALR